jgi:FkbM family methyltransferase
MIYKKLREILPKIDHPVVVEIGAHIGTDTAKLARLLKKPFVYLAIEADIRNHQQLERVCNENGVSGVLPTAIGRANEIVPFYYSTGSKKGQREHTDSSSLKEPIQTSKRPPWVKFSQGYVISMTLDHIFSLYNLKHIDLIWMDVQGAELDVFEGGRMALKNTSYIYTECQAGRYEGQPGLKGILGALSGWERVLMDGENVLLRNGND